MLQNKQREESDRVLIINARLSIFWRIKMTEVYCPNPNCGAPMVLRTARRGPNTGKQFYGCSRYPGCKETRPYDETYFIDDKKVLIFPRMLVARPKLQSFQVRFFQTCIVPENLMEKIRNDEINEELLKAFSQWRVDFPLVDGNFLLTEKESHIISVMEKILTRGRITYLSPELEKHLVSLFNKKQLNNITSDTIRFIISNTNHDCFSHQWFDSNEEKKLFMELLPIFLGNTYKRFVIPGVELSSLVQPGSVLDSLGNQKVDFCIFHPGLDEKIVVEVDGDQHREHKSADNSRDQMLQENGYSVVRIPALEIQNGTGRQLSILQNKISHLQDNIEKQINSEGIDNLKFMIAINITHKIQITILQALQSGYFRSKDPASWTIFSDIEQLGIFSRDESIFIFEKSLFDFFELYKNVCDLYRINLNDGIPAFKLSSEDSKKINNFSINISFLNHKIIGAKNFYIQDIYFPHDIAFTTQPTSPPKEKLNIPNEEALEYFLNYLFRKEHFREGQYKGLSRVLLGDDVLMLLPTGAGKSLVYQLSFFLLPGRTVVIDPIISLMNDQIDNLSFMGIDRCIALTSQISNIEDKMRAMNLFGQGEYLFAYVAPERFQTIEFRNSLRSLTVHTPISLIVVDEAHCVSEWGHDFRTAYLNIGRTARTYCESAGHVPPIVALTGTASRAVLKDVQRELKIEDFDAMITPKSFDRQELKFNIIHSKSGEKLSRLKGYLGQVLPNLFNTTGSTLYQAKGKETYSGLIFCPHVNGKFGIVELSQNIKNDLGIHSEYYSGKAPKSIHDDTYNIMKQVVSKSFKRNKTPLMVCTKAFGMGIDKPNIRYTVHYGLPSSIEAFYQEAGRAGRDRRTAYCCLIVSADDSKRAEKLLNPRTGVEEINRIIESTGWEEADDITRMLFFHKNAFRGIDRERKDIEMLLQYIGDITVKRKSTITVSKEERNRIEKALHRLLLIGLISDYTIDYSKYEFVIELTGADKEDIIEAYGNYIAGYLSSRRKTEIDRVKSYFNLPFYEFLNEVINILLIFIYDVIERGRRRALSEMLLACTEANTDASIRKRMLNYLEATAFSEGLEEILNSEVTNFSNTMDVFAVIRSPNEAAELRGQVIRYLESYPDHPGLLMLRSLSELYVKDINSEVAQQNFITAIDSALLTYKINENIVYEFAIWGISCVLQRDNGLTINIIKELLSIYKSEAFARLMIKSLPEFIAVIPAWFLLDRINEKCIEILT